MSHKYFAEQDKVESTDLFITEKCNLKCSYCFHKQSPLTLDLETGKKILGRYHESCPDAFKITFFGGEPMLYPEMVLELAQYARSIWGKAEDGGEKVGFTTTTNCMYFDADMFKKFMDMHFSFCLSVDGDRETTLMHRKGSDFDKITANMKSILKLAPTSTVRMTFSPDTVGRLAHNVQFLHEQGARIVMPHAVMEADWSEEAVKQYAYQLKQIYHYRRFMARQGHPIDVVSIDKALKVMNDELPIEKNFCEAGKCYIATLPNGDVYPCHRAASNRLFKLGNILDAEPLIIRGMFLSIDKESTGCVHKCPAHPICRTCLMVHYMVNNSISSPVGTYCELNRVEATLARDYLMVELGDRRDRMLESQALVLSDLVEQNEEFKTQIKKLTNKPKET